MIEQNNLQKKVQRHCTSSSSILSKFSLHEILTILSHEELRTYIKTMQNTKLEG